MVVGTAAILALCLAIPARAQIAGFGGTGVNWTLNNDPASQSIPTVANNVLRLASSVNTDNSAFYDTPQYIGSFTASFVFQNLQGGDGEGFVFAMQNQGTNAVSVVGGNYLGYHGLSLATGLAFDISPQSGAGPGLGYAPTQVPGGGPGGYIHTGAVNFRGTDPIAANVSYANQILSVTVTDLLTQATFTTNFVENLEAAVGGSTAFVGFTGGGTAVLNLSISSFVFTLGVQPAIQSNFPVVLKPGTNVDVTKLSGNESDGVIAYNPQNPSQLFVAANTNVEAGLFGAYCSSVMTGTNLANIAITNLTPTSLAGLPPGEYPAVAWDGYGNLFLAYADGAFSGIDVALSTNAGASFSFLTNLATGHFALEPRIAVGVGTNMIGPGTNAGSVWVLYKDYSLAFSPLVAQGAAVTNLGTNAVGHFGVGEIVAGSTNNCGFGDIAVGPQGQVMVAYQSLYDPSGLVNCYTSLDPDGLGPATFANEVLAAQNAVGGNTLIPASPDGQGINAAVGLAWDINPASQQYGRVYLDWVGQGSGDANDTDIFVASSTDSGVAWSQQQTVNDDSGNNSQFLPRMAVDTTSGALALSWYDCRNDTGAPIDIKTVVTNIVTNDPGDTPPTNFSTNYSTNTTSSPSPTTNQAAMIYATVSLNGGVTFQPNVKVSTDTTTGYVASLAGSPTDFGDYAGLAFYGGTFYPVWADNAGKAPNPGPTNTFDVVMEPVTLTGLSDVSIKSVLVNSSPTNHSPLTGTNLLQIGSVIDYLLTASNNGPSAVTAAYVTNVFPTNVSVVIAFPTNTNNTVLMTSYHLNGNTLIWSVGALPVLKNATILVETTVVGIGYATNYATITPGAGVSDVLTNNNATNMVTFISAADLYLTITNTPSQIGYGAPQVTYTMTVSNQGPVGATGVLISNTLSTNLVLAGVSYPFGDTYTTNASQNSVTFNIGPMTNGQTVTVSVTAYAPTNLAYAGPASATCSTIVLGVMDPTITNDSVEAVVPIVTPDLGIGMTASVLTMAVGDTITYTLNITNLGPVPAFAVTVTNALPSDLQVASVSVRKGTYTTSPDPIVPGQTDIIASFYDPLPAGLRTEVIITAIAQSLGTATNVAVVGNIVVDLNPANNTARVVTPVLPPDMAIGMKGSSAYIGVWDPVTYTILVSNLGPVVAHGVIITNALPTNLQFSSASVRKGVYTMSPNPLVAGQTNIIATFDEPLLVGQSTEVTITATGLSLGSATNVATVADTVLDPNVGNNTAQVVTPVLAPQMVIGMTGSPAFIPVGGLVTYALTVTNLGPVVAYGVLITNSLPANLQFTAATVKGGTYTSSPDPLVPGQTDVIANFGTLLAGQTATMTLTAIGVSLGQATNIAVVYDNRVDPNQVNNTAKVVTPVVAPALNLAMTGSPAFITVGQKVTYVMTVVNPGPVTALNVVISNTLPPNLSYSSASNALGTFTHSQNEVVFQLGTLTNGQVAVVTVVAQSTALGLATNVAEVYDSQVSPNLTNSTAEVVTPVVGPDVAVGMTGSPTTAYVGQTVIFTLNVTNLGPPSAMGVYLTNYPLPANFSFEGVSVPLGMSYVADANGILFNIGSMSNGQTVTVSIAALAIKTGEATNTAIVGDVLDDSFDTNNIASEVTTITNAPLPFSNLTVTPGVTGVFITWNTLSNSTSQVFYGLTPDITNYTWLNPAPTNYHTVLLTGLMPDTNYYFQASSIVGAVPGSSTTNGSLVTILQGVSAVTNTTNGYFSTTSTEVLEATDANRFGPGWYSAGSIPGIFSYDNTYVYYYAQGVAGSPTSSDTYTPNIPVPGFYDVSVWYPIKPGYFSSNTPMYATGTSNQVEVNVNQAANGGSWQPLVTGLFFATNGFTGSLAIYNNTGDTTTSVVVNGARWAYELSQDAPTNGSVPAWWAEFYFTNTVSGTNDPYGVGYSNFEEYILGADPTSRSSQLQFVVTPGPTNVTAAFAPFMGGRIYQLQSSTDLRNPAWMTLTNTAAQNTNDGSGLFTVGRAQGAAAFYRLAVCLSTNQ